MSSNSSINRPICESCDKSTQQDLPAQDPLATSSCGAAYERVVACMNEHRGQVAPCSRQWQGFKECRERHQDKEGRQLSTAG
jgi:hypothetical protein